MPLEIHEFGGDRDDTHEKRGASPAGRGERRRDGGGREVVRFEEIDGRYTLIDPSLPFFLSFAIKLRRWMQVNINESYK